LIGRKEAGKGDLGPFKTYLKYTIAPNEIRKFAMHNKLQVFYYDSYDAGDPSYFWLNKGPLARYVIAAYNMLWTLAHLLTLGKLGNSEFIIVLKK
jgi:hypothetical protein